MKTFLICVLLSITLTILAGYLVIPLLRKLKANQPILSYVKIHDKKSGTPTMAGIFFIPISIIVFLIFKNESDYLALLTIAITLAFMLVGFIDDYIKIKLKRNEGLTAVQKLLFQIAISLIASYFCYKSGLNFMYLPFANKTINLGYFTIILNVLVFIATVNSVNLTDGLDGLCSNVSYIYLIAISLIILLQIKNFNSSYVNEQEYVNLALYSICLASALIGYLFFNTSKAKVFMGDSGSLAIGGAISAISIFSGNTLLIPLLGICYLISSLSVIIQVLYYKKTKKRVFLMAPFHHHLQEKGMSEAKISFIYWLVTLLVSLILIYFYL